MIIQSPCKPPCTPDFCKVFCHHGFMKSDLRISVKDYRRSKTLKIQLAQVNFSSSRQCTLAHGWQTRFHHQGAYGANSEHCYEDKFITAERFQWQSQNRTTQSSKHVQMLKNHAEKAACPNRLAPTEQSERWPGARPDMFWDLSFPINRARANGEFQRAENGVPNGHQARTGALT